MGVVIDIKGRRSAGRNAAQVGQHLRDSYSVPACDAELAGLLSMAQGLLDRMTDDTLDGFLTALDAWEKRRAAG